jgi:hypothetical protein
MPTGLDSSVLRPAVWLGTACELDLTSSFLFVALHDRELDGVKLFGSRDLEEEVIRRTVASSRKRSKHRTEAQKVIASTGRPDSRN